MPVATPRRLYAQLGHLVHEVVRFGLVGAANVVVDVGIFNALLFGPLERKPLTAKVISTGIAIISSYFMNRHWTWRERARTGILRELPLFLVLSGIGLGITLGCLAVSHYGLDLTSKLADNIAANVIGLGLSMVWRFWSFKRWVFLAPPGETEPATPAEAAMRTAD
ncbi:MAG: GtrA family protein [Frankiaceae bacterium]